MKTKSIPSSFSQLAWQCIGFILVWTARVLAHTLYRFRVHGQEYIPQSGAAILACNHVSFIDAVLIMAASPRPVRFIMDYRIFANPFIGWFFRLCRAIPIAPKHEQPALYDSAFEACLNTLQNGELLAIFPEGGITRTGALQPLKSGILKITQQIPTPIIPMGLRNLWGSFFSRIEGAAMVKPFRRGWRNTVTLTLSAPLHDCSLETLSEKIYALSSHTSSKIG
jgi:1-acyl-sn-glycerol-3-phosphate acyltransferase